MNARIPLAVCIAGLIGVAIGYVHGRHGAKAPPQSWFTALERAPNIASGALHMRKRESCQSPSETQSDEPSEPAIARAAPPGGENPAALFEASLQETRADERFEIMRIAFAQLLTKNATNAIAQLHRASAEDQDAVLTVALPAWASSHPDLAINLLNGAALPDSYRALVLGGLADTDARQAAQWLQRNGQLAQSADLHRAVVPALVRADLDLAAQIVREMEADAPPDLVQQVAAEYARHDPQRAYAWASTLFAGNEYRQAQLLEALTASVVAANPDAAAAFLNGTNDARTRTALLSEIATYKARTSVSDGWQWLSGFRSDPSYRENARALLSRWSFAKPSEVAHVVQGIGDAEFQRALAEQLAAVWRERDPIAYREWVTSLPSGALRNALANDVEG